MTGRPLVSVVIPCFNYGRFLGEAIESALGQTHQPIEVIVVDDGSSDNSIEVARRYPVQLIVQPNSGVCVAANTGIRASTGEFVLRLDADDRLCPTYVEETLAALEHHPDAHFAYTETEYFGTASGTYPVESFNPETLAERNYIHASALMRRASFDRSGGYNLNMTGARYEDWDLWLSFAERGMPGVFVPRPLLLYRQHPVPTRGTLGLASIADLKRELRAAADLRDNHPVLFGTGRLVRRLATAPSRLVSGTLSPRTAVLLACFYGVMLARAALGKGGSLSTGGAAAAHFDQRPF